MDGLKSPYTNGACPTPGLEGNLGGTTGGADLTDGKKESDNSVSGLPAQQTTVGLADAPGVGSVVDWPELKQMGNVASK